MNNDESTVFLEPHNNFFKFIKKSTKCRLKNTKEEKTVFEKYLNNCFVDIEHSIPRFQQELFDLQIEYYKVWKNSIQTTITLQKEFTKNLGIITDIPQTYQKIIETMIEESIKMALMRNQIYSKWIDTTKKNIMLVNNNSELFFANWKKIIDFWTVSSKKE